MEWYPALVPRCHERNKRRSSLIKLQYRPVSSVGFGDLYHLRSSVYGKEIQLVLINSDRDLDYLLKVFWIWTLICSFKIILVWCLYIHMSHTVSTRNFQTSITQNVHRSVTRNVNKTSTWNVHMSVAWKLHTEPPHGLCMWIYHRGTVSRGTRLPTSNTPGTKSGHGTVGEGWMSFSSQSSVGILLLPYTKIYE